MFFLYFRSLYEQLRRDASVTATNEIQEKYTINNQFIDKKLNRIQLIQNYGSVQEFGLEPGAL